VQINILNKKLCLYDHQQEEPFKKVNTLSLCSRNSTCN